MTRVLTILLLSCWSLAAQVVLQSPMVLNSPVALSQVTPSDLQRGLVGWWKFDEGAGTSITDSSGNSNNGNLSATGCTWTNGGVCNGALIFNGSSGYVNITNSSSLSITNALTISMWFYLNASIGQLGTLIGKGYNGAYVPYDCDGRKDVTGNAGTPFYLSMIYFDGSSHGTLSTFDFNDSSSLGKWWHFCGMTGTNGAYIYLNGFLNSKNTSISAALPTTTKNVTIPALDINGTIGRFVNCIIDDVRIYNRYLTASEVYALSNWRP